MKCSKCGKEIANESMFCEFCGEKLTSIDSNDEMLLNVIRVASYDRSMFAAYKAQRHCYKLCKEQTHRIDYKDHVRQLQVDHYPAEFQKAMPVASFCTLLIWSIIGIVVSLFFAIYGWVAVIDWDDEFLWMAIPSTLLLILFCWLIIRKYNKTKEILNNIEE